MNSRGDTERCSSDAAVMSAIVSSTGVSLLLTDPPVMSAERTYSPAPLVPPGHHPWPGEFAVRAGSHSHRVRQRGFRVAEDGTCPVANHEENTVDRYPKISDHGLIGDLQTAALVSADGVVDWLCCPRFDSPSVFASLLDADRGGYMRIAPDRNDYVSKQLYFPDTAILITRFMTPDGVGEVQDFMPVAGAVATDRHRLVRQLRVVRGTLRFAIDIQPAFDYARQPHKLDLSENGAVFESDGMELTLHWAAPPEVSVADSGITVERHGDGLRATRTLQAGQSGGFVLESMGGPPRRIAAAELQRLLDET